MNPSTNANKKEVVKQPQVSSYSSNSKDKKVSATPTHTSKKSTPKVQKDGPNINNVALEFVDKVSSEKKNDLKDINKIELHRKNSSNKTPVHSKPKFSDNELNKIKIPNKDLNLGEYNSNMNNQYNPYLIQNNANNVNNPYNYNSEVNNYNKFPEKKKDKEKLNEKEVAAARVIQKYCRKKKKVYILI